MSKRVRQRLFQSILSRMDAVMLFSIRHASTQEVVGRIGIKAKYSTGIIALVSDETRLDETGTVHHIGNLTNGTFNIGDQVSSKVDHDRRSINTRLHSAGHVIDMTIDSLGLDWIATKGQHYPDLSAVEFSGTWQPDHAEKLKYDIESRANELMRGARDNELRFLPVEDMHTICRHVPENIPTNKPGRVVIYDGNFGIPCGGTHVKNLQEIGRVTVPKLKEKKGMIRVNYTVDGIN